MSRRERAHRYTLAEVVQFTEAKPWQVESWTRAGVVTPGVKSTGTGRARSYSFMNLVQVAVALALKKVGMRGGFVSDVAADIPSLLKDRPKGSKTLTLRLQVRKDSDVYAGVVLELGKLIVHLEKATGDYMRTQGGSKGEYLDAVVENDAEPSAPLEKAPTRKRKAARRG